MSTLSIPFAKVLTGSVVITCACGCGRSRHVKAADVKRGWGKYFDKSCKARHQERRTGQHRKFLKLRARAIATEDRGGFYEPEEFSGYPFHNDTDCQNSDPNDSNPTIHAR